MLASRQIVSKRDIQDINLLLRQRKEWKKQPWANTSGLWKKKTKHSISAGKFFPGHNPSHKWQGCANSAHVRNTLLYLNRNWEPWISETNYWGHVDTNKQTFYRNKIRRRKRRSEKDNWRFNDIINCFHFIPFYIDICFSKSLVKFLLKSVVVFQPYETDSTEI